RAAGVDDVDSVGPRALPGGCGARAGQTGRSGGGRRRRQRAEHPGAWLRVRAGSAPGRPLGGGARLLPRRLAPAGPTRAARAGRACRTARSGRLAEPVGRPLPACGRRAGSRVRAAARVPAEAERGRQRVGGGQPRTRGFHRPAGRLDEPRDAALRRVPGHGGATPARLTTHAARSPIPARTVGPSGYCRGMDVVLVPGILLDASLWDAVVPALRAAGHRPHPMTLPGLESREADRAGITLRDHVAAVVAEI